MAFACVLSYRQPDQMQESMFGGKLTFMEYLVCGNGSWTDIQEGWV